MYYEGEQKNRSARESAVFFDSMGGKEGYGRADVGERVIVYANEGLVSVCCFWCALELMSENGSPRAADCVSVNLCKDHA